MAPPAPKPGGGLNLKKLPPWAWAVAIAGGAIVGFVLLKPPGRELETEGEPAAGEPSERRGGGGGAGAIPGLDSLLDAFGLEPGDFYAPDFTDGFEQSSEEGSYQDPDFSTAFALERASSYQGPSAAVLPPSESPTLGQWLGGGPSTAYAPSAAVVDSGPTTWTPPSTTWTPAAPAPTPSGGSATVKAQ